MYDIETQGQTSTGCYRLNVVVHVSVPSENVGFVRIVDAALLRDREPAARKLEACRSAGKVGRQEDDDMSENPFLFGLRTALCREQDSVGFVNMMLVHYAKKPRTAIQAHIGAAYAAPTLADDLWGKGPPVRRIRHG